MKEAQVSSAGEVDIQAIVDVVDYSFAKLEVLEECQSWIEAYPDQAYVVDLLESVYQSLILAYLDSAYLDDTCQLAKLLFASFVVMVVLLPVGDTELEK